MQSMSDLLLFSVNEQFVSSYIIASMHTHTLYRIDDTLSAGYIKVPTCILFLISFPAREYLV